MADGETDPLLLHLLGNEGVSSFTDVDHYVIITESLDSVFSMFSIHSLVRNSDVLTQYFSFVRYDAHWFVEWME